MTIYEIINTLIILFLFGYLFILLLLFLKDRLSLCKVREKKTVLLVRVSRENEVGPLAAEQIFSALHNLVAKIGFFQFLSGKTQEAVSFEIANVNNSIKFFVVLPNYLRTMVEGHIYSQYPTAEISEVHDYVIKADDYNFYSAELKLEKYDFFPIKPSFAFEEKSTKINLDPLSSITGTLNNLSDESDLACVQIVVSPISDKTKGYLEKLMFSTLTLPKFLAKYYWRYYFSESAFLRFLFFPFTLIFAPKINSFNSQKDSEKTGSASEKINKFLFNTTIRLFYATKSKEKKSSLMKINEIFSSFKQFSGDLNSFKISERSVGLFAFNIFVSRRLRNAFVLNNVELSTVFHLPNIHVQTPNVYWVKSKRLEPPNDLPIITNDTLEDLSPIGITNYRNVKKTFGIKTVDRARHMYLIGKTGMGKSTLLENMICSDILSNRGVALIDPHGDLADKVIDFVPARRTNDVIIFDPSDVAHPIAFNMLENINPALSSIITSGLVGIFKKIYAESWGPRLEHILRNTIMTLLEYPDTTMLGIVRILQDSDYRKRVVKKIKDPLLKSFWHNEFEKFDQKTRIEAISPILNKVGQFLASPIIRNILGQVKSKIDFRNAMDNRQIVIVNLSKGKIGEDNSSLLGSMLITKFQIDAMSRADIPESERRNFYLYVDEFQNFATDSFATILSEARKYKLNLTMANQYISQMKDEVKDAIFGNVGTILSYQVGVDDAEYLSLQFSEEVTTSDLVNLPKYNAYMRLLNDGMPSKTFSINTMPPVSLKLEEGRREKVIRMSRQRYSVSKQIVEDKILRWSRGLDFDEAGGLKN